jgi:hypothetical protein
MQSCVIEEQVEKEFVPSDLEPDLVAEKGET